MDSNIKFDTNNQLPLFNSGEWSFSDGVYIENNHLIIPPNGIAEVDVSSLYNKTFIYFKSDITGNCSAFGALTPLRTDILIKLDLMYFSTSGSINQAESFTMNFANIKNVSNGYNDIKILQTRNKAVASAKLSIKNNTNKNFTIYSIGLYTSFDISVSQLVQVQNNQTAQIALRKFLIGTDKATGNILRYIKAFIANNSYIKIKPHYDGNRLIQITFSNQSGAIITEYEDDEDETVETEE